MDKAALLRSLQNQIDTLQSSPSADIAPYDGSPSRDDPSYDDIISGTRSYQEAFNRIVRLVSTRDRSEQELRERLLKEEFEFEEVDQALNRAKSCNLIDDERFAHARIAAQISKGKGIAGIERDLETFGINANDLDGWPEEFFPLGRDSEFKRALELLAAKPSRSTNPLKGNYSKLIRYGYSPEVAYSAARAYEENRA